MRPCPLSSMLRVTYLVEKSRKIQHIFRMSKALLQEFCLKIFEKHHTLKNIICKCLCTGNKNINVKFLALFVFPKKNNVLMQVPTKNYKKISNN
jgi:hypothetical protein